MHELTAHAASTALQVLLLLLLLLNNSVVLHNKTCHRSNRWPDHSLNHRNQAAIVNTHSRLNAQIKACR
jgi:hypothetical protein